MKKGIFIILILFFNLSCQNEKLQELEKKITELETKNSELRYYIDNNEKISIINSQLIGIPEERDYKVNEVGKLNFGFLKYGKIKNYKVYMKKEADKDYELIYNNLSDAKFKLEFTPKSLNDNRIDIFAEFEGFGKDSIIRISTKTGLNVVE